MHALYSYVYRTGAGLLLVYPIADKNLWLYDVYGTINRQYVGTADILQHSY